MGASDRAVSDWSLDARVKDLDAIVSRVGSRRLVLAGLDHGATTAIAYAARNPDRVSHLILLCPWASGAAHFSLPAVRLATQSAPAAGEEWGVFTNILGSVLTDFADPNRRRNVGRRAYPRPRNRRSAQRHGARRNPRS